MTIRDELLALRDQQGTLHVTEVHDWASEHRESALAQRLNWDDPSAARAHRYEQIRLLIRVYVVDENRDRQTLVLRSEYRHGGGYRAIEEAFTNADLREMALADALDELERIQEKYQYLTQLAEVFLAVSRVRRRARHGTSRQSGASQGNALQA